MTQSTLSRASRESGDESVTVQRTYWLSRGIYVHQVGLRLPLGARLDSRLRSQQYKTSIHTASHTLTVRVATGGAAIGGARLVSLSTRRHGPNTGALPGPTRSMHYGFPCATLQLPRSMHTGEAWNGASRHATANSHPTYYDVCTASRSHDGPAIHSRRLILYDSVCDDCLNIMLRHLCRHPPPLQAIPCHQTRSEAMRAYSCSAIGRPIYF